MKIFNLFFLAVITYLFSCKSDDNDCNFGSDEDPKGASFNFTFLNDSTSRLDSIKIVEVFTDTSLEMTGIYDSERNIFSLTDVFFGSEALNYGIYLPNGKIEALVLSASKEVFDDCLIHYDATYGLNGVCNDCSYSEVYILEK